MNQRVIVIGGGVIGTAIALQLAEQKHAVTVIERGQLGGESSWAGAGLLSALLPWQYPEPVNRLIQTGRAMYPEWTRQLALESGVDPEYSVSGMLVLPQFDEDVALSWAARNQEPIECVSAQFHLPLLAQDGPALWLPRVAQVRNPRLLRSLQTLLIKRGVVLQERVSADSFEISQDQVVSLATSVGRQPADTFIIAAGAWTPSLLPFPKLDIRPMRGQIVLLKGAAGLFQHIVYQDSFYIIPRRDGHVLLGSTLEDVGFDKGTTEEARAALLNRAKAILPMLQSFEVVRQWSGLRPAAPDNIPTIGRHPDISNLYVCGGHYRYGVTMAPSSAKLLVDLIYGRQPMIDPEPYRWRK